MSTKPAASNNTQAKPQTTQAGDNGAAKDDAENAIAQKAAKLSAEERKALAARVLEGDADENDLKMFEVLKTENMKANAARKVHIDSIKAAVEALVGTTRPLAASDIQSLFSKDLISELAIGMGLNKGNQSQSTPVTGAKRPRGPKAEYPSDKAAVLFHFPSLGTAGDLALSYHIGRINEKYKNDTANKAPFHPSNKAMAPAKLKKHGTSVAELMGYLPKDEENRQAAISHLKTDAGVAEVAAIISLVTGKTASTEQVKKDIASELEKQGKQITKQAA